jgi:hypothetical protein
MPRCGGESTGNGNRRMEEMGSEGRGRNGRGMEGKSGNREMRNG